MAKRLRMGVIGTGMAWERLHWPALQKLTNEYEVAAVCNKEVEKAEGFADSISLAKENVYADYKEMLRRDDIDVIDLLVPISENYEIAKDVIMAGKNLIAEKPFASTPEAAQELTDLKNEYGVVVLVAENYRYNEEDNIIKQLISSGAIGEVMYFIENKGGNFEKDMTQNTFAAKEWRQHPAFPGGTFLDSSIHDIARMRFLFGDTKNVSAFARPQQEEYCPYQCVNALIQFRDDTIGHYAYYPEASEQKQQPVGLRIFGTLGEIYLESPDKGVLEIYYKDGRSEQRTFTPGMGYYHELVNFYRHINYGDPIISTPEKELGDIKLIFDILSSIESGSTVKK